METITGPEDISNPITTDLPLKQTLEVLCQEVDFTPEQWTKAEEMFTAIKQTKIYPEIGARSLDLEFGMEIQERTCSGIVTWAIEDIVKDPDSVERVIEEYKKAALEYTEQLNRLKMYVVVANAHGSLSEQQAGVKTGIARSTIRRWLGK